MSLGPCQTSRMKFFVKRCIIIFWQDPNNIFVKHLNSFSWSLLQLALSFFSFSFLFLGLFEFFYLVFNHFQFRACIASLETKVKFKFKECFDIYDFSGKRVWKYIKQTLRQKCPYSEFFSSVFSRIRTEYGEILNIQSEWEKIRTRKTPNMHTFHAVRKMQELSECKKRVKEPQVILYSLLIPNRTWLLFFA